MVCSLYYVAIGVPEVKVVLRQPYFRFSSYLLDDSFYRVCFGGEAAIASCFLVNSLFIAAERQYRDSVADTVQENSIVFSLI